MGAVIPEAAELPTQISRKICVESPIPAPGAFHGTDSLVLVLDDGKDLPDGASKQSNHEQESVPLVSSSIEAFCHSTAGNATEFLLWQKETDLSVWCVALQVYVKPKTGRRKHC